MQVEREPDGSLVVRGVTPLHAAMLAAVPELLECDDPRVRSRLLPETYEDPDEEEQWRRHVTPELEHLFASRAELIGGDLRALELDDDMTFRLRIPPGHETAWLTGLNAARLALFELHDLEDVDMERDPGELGDPEKELALVRIHVLAYLQEMLMEAGGV